MDNFELVWAESQSLDSRESKKDILYTGTLHMYLDERDNRTDQMQDLRIVSHGTMQVSPFSSINKVIINMSRSLYNINERLKDSE